MHEQQNNRAFLELPTSQNRIEIEDFLILGAQGPFPGTDQDTGVSDRHARIERREGGYILRDLRSDSGTFLNGNRICEAWLQCGDELKIGNSICYFSSQTETEALPDLGMKSRSPAWKEQLQRLGSIASTSFPVLILGPSGTGKEVIAEKIHFNSARPRGPFVRVNCSALTETLIESELFGHVKGSFTGASADRKGAFETARGGTLFLDEIGDLPYTLQAKLLRALENNEIRPVGSDRAVQTDVRIVSATHQNLLSKIVNGEFRQDLYYRLNVISISTPPLSDRMDDFEDLLYHFARQMRVRFSHKAIQRLKRHRWPGNIRELRNTVARASAIFPGVQIESEHIEKILDPIQSTLARTMSLGEFKQSELPVLKEIERQMILKRLVANNGNQRRTAIELGLPKSTLHDRLKTYQIDPHQFSEQAKLAKVEDSKASE